MRCLKKVAIVIMFKKQTQVRYLVKQVKLGQIFVLFLYLFVPPKYMVVPLKQQAYNTNKIGSQVYIKIPTTSILKTNYSGTIE